MQSKVNCDLRHGNGCSAEDGARTGRQESGWLVAADMIIDTINRYAPNLCGNAGIPARKLPDFSSQYFSRIRTLPGATSSMIRDSLRRAVRTHSQDGGMCNARNSAGCDTAV